MVTTSEVAVSVTIDDDAQLNEIIKELEPFGTIEIDREHTIVSIVGNEINETKNVLQHLFNSLTDIPVRMVNYGGSHHNISILIPKEYKTKTLQLLNKGLFGLE